MLRDRMTKQWIRQRTKLLMSWNCKDDRQSLHQNLMQRLSVILNDHQLETNLKHYLKADNKGDGQTELRKLQA